MLNPLLGEMFYGPLSNMTATNQIQNEMALMTNLKVPYPAEWYRDRLKGMQILLSTTQAEPGRAGKQQQEQTSPNHVRPF